MHFYRLSSTFSMLDDFNGHYRVWTGFRAEGEAAAVFLGAGASHVPTDGFKANLTTGQLTSLHFKLQADSKQHLSFSFKPLKIYVKIF